MGVVAEYTDLRILKGTYKEHRAFAVHGCPELSRPEFSKSAGTLETLEIGAHHRLELLSENFYHLELVYGQELKPAQAPLFYVLRADSAGATSSKPPPGAQHLVARSRCLSGPQPGGPLTPRCSGQHR